MSHITLAQQGVAAVDSRNWDEGVTKLSKALQSSTNPAWLIARSKALIGLNRFEEALNDADLAWHTAFQRNKRDLLSQAHYRRAVSYFRLKQYANADCCCIYSMRLIKGHPAVEKEDPALQHVDDKGLWTATAEDATLEARNDDINKGQSGAVLSQTDQNPQAREWRMASTLRIQALSAMAKLPEDDPARKLTVSLKPEEKKLADFRPAKEAAPTPTPAPAAAKPSVPSDTPLRIQEFQSNTTMSVSIFSKGVNKEKLQVDFQPTHVRLDRVIYPSGDEREYQLDLWGEIDPQKSKFSVTPNKVELSLAKKTAGKWPTLTASSTSSTKSTVPVSATKPISGVKEAATESGPSPTITKEQEEEKKEAPAPASAAAAQGPSYPSSSRSGPKNWDSIGEDDKSDDDKDVNSFFKSLYKNATPEQQRAMMKSFTESNGTSLSTSWEDVKDKKVETAPPDGLEAKKWEI